MPTELKFCGMTRAEDAREACRLRAAYVGVIFAGGPRQQSHEGAAAVFAGVGAGTARVGVFAAVPPQQIADAAAALELDVVQLHGDPDPESIENLRAHFAGKIWAVMRVGAGELPSAAEAMFETADAVVLDAFVHGKLGGTGVALPWSELASQLDRPRRGGRLVLAGGLRPENVAQAIQTIAPDIVDVSSGVEKETGIKDHARMRAFSQAVFELQEDR